MASLTNIFMWIGKVRTGMIANARCNTWYWLGDIFSRIPIAYWLYNFCMCRSFELNERYGLDVWTKADSDEH